MVPEGAKKVDKQSAKTITKIELSWHVCTLVSKCSLLTTQKESRQDDGMATGPPDISLLCFLAQALCLFCRVLQPRFPPSVHYLIVIYLMPVLQTSMHPGKNNIELRN